MNPTQLVYYLDSSITGAATIVDVGTEDGGNVVLDRTLFHPAGGGQKADIGKINGVTVSGAKNVDGYVLHFVGDTSGLRAGDAATMEIDAASRLLNSRYHTAGHLVASVIEQVLGCAAVSGQHWPGESFMRFEGAEVPTQQDMQRCLDMIAAAVTEDREVSVRIEGDRRLVTIAGFAAVPCGGTHVSSIGSLGPISLGTPRFKQRKMQVSYRLDDNTEGPRRGL